ncbi:MAG: phage holin family protein [Actinomycetota bacterium]|nr:phage holin family protein [Actinomycetota bacterium]
MASSMRQQRISGPGPADDRSLQELWSAMTAEAALLLRKEVELAKIETKEQLQQAGQAGVAFGATALAGFMALQLLSFAAAWGLAAVLPTGVAFLIVGAVYLVAAVVLLRSARAKAADVQVVPQQTVETLKEDVQWARARRR